VTSPDLPVPVDLTLHEVNENELVDAAQAAFQIAMPDWIPQEGATEVVLIESLALLIGQQVFALNQLPRIVLDGLIAIRGYARNTAVPAAGQIAVTMSAASIGTRILPVGARFRLPDDVGGTFDVLAAETTTLNPADALVGTVNVVAEVPGSAPNGTPPGTPALMVDTQTWIESAVVSTALTGGADIEDDAEFYARVAAAFQASSTTLVTDTQFAVAALGVSGVGRAVGYGLWDGVGAVGTVPGHISVAVAAPDGSDVSPAVKSAVLTRLTAGAVAGLVVHVIDFTRVTMNLAVTYTLAAGYSSATVSPAIEAVLRAWINPATWPLPETLTSINQIILRIGSVPGVDNVTAVTGLVPVTGGATLPTLGTVTLTAV
jgi:uncharacterized phage protein gp47/JayE